MKPVHAIDTEAIMQVSLQTPGIPNFIRTDDGRPRSELLIESDRRHARAVLALLKEKAQ